MAFDDQITAQASADFDKRLDCAITKATIDIGYEDQSSMPAAKATKRNDLVKIINADNSHYIRRLKKAIISDLDSRAVDLSDLTSTGVSDAELNTSTAAVWDRIANVTYADANP